MGITDMLSKILSQEIANAINKDIINTLNKSNKINKIKDILNKIKKHE